MRGSYILRRPGARPHAHVPLVFKIEGVKLIIELGFNLAWAARSPDVVEDRLPRAEHLLNAGADRKAPPGATIYAPSRRDGRDNAPMESFFASEEGTGLLRGLPDTGRGAGQHL
jgi:hypothetical protein